MSPGKWKSAPFTDFNVLHRLVQIAMVVADDSGKLGDQQ